MQELTQSDLLLLSGVEQTGASKIESQEFRSVTLTALSTVDSRFWFSHSVLYKNTTILKWYNLLKIRTNPTNTEHAHLHVWRT